MILYLKKLKARKWAIYRADRDLDLANRVDTNIEFDNDHV